MEACMLNFLYAKSVRARCLPRNGDELFCKLEARSEVPIDPREYILPSSLTYCLGS